MVELATILVGVVVPLIIGPLSVFCKSLWDRYSNSREIKKKNKYETKMKEYTDKINLFYWPVYLKLKTLDRISYQNCVNEKNQDDKKEVKTFQIDIGYSGQTSATDYSSDNLNSPLTDTPEISRKKKKWKKCANPLCERRNQQIHLSKYCLQCRNTKQNNINTEDNVTEILSETDDNMDETLPNQFNVVLPNLLMPVQRQESIRHLNFHNDETLEEENILVTVDSVMLEELDKKILKISLDIKNLVEKNISIVQPSKKLIREIVKFSRFTEMLEIIHYAKKKTNKKYNIHSFGVVNNTESFHILIKLELEKLMIDYKNTFDNYNAIKGIGKSSCCSRS